jgi:tetratricopeptide (TPR) repeat protein
MNSAERTRYATIRASNDEEIWIQHGDEMMHKGDLSKAMEYYDHALEGSSNHTLARAWHSKANALDSMGKHEDAIRCYDNSLKCDDQNAECWFNKGLTLKKMGKEDEGLACINLGVQIAMGR